MIERSNSIYCREDITDKQIERHILMKPFRRFEEMHMMRHTKTLGIIEMDNSVWKRLTEAEKTEIKGICEEKLGLYYRRMVRNSLNEDERVIPNVDESDYLFLL